jgi:CP12 domain
MKIALLLLSLSASQVAAFAPRHHAFVASSKALSSSALRMSSTTSRPDVTKAVAAAVDAAKKFGPASPEARLAWETVEELSASDNRCVADCCWQLRGVDL